MARHIQQVPSTKRWDHGSASQTLYSKSPHQALDLPTHSHPCCERPLVIEPTPELLDALEASGESGCSDDEGEGDDDSSCDLGTAELPM